nr:uncharacterized protein LOC111507277 [Leptinotarsa decemlineata]
MKSRRELDSVYIFAKMKVEDAFLYVATQTPLGPEDKFVKRWQPYYNDTFTSSNTQSSLAKFHGICKSSDLIDKLKNTNDEYQELLRQYSAKCPGVSAFPSTIIGDLQNAYSQFQRETPAEKEEEEEGPVQAKRLIKNRAMANKNAVYRGCKKVKTAVDMNTNDSPISSEMSD